MGELTTGRPLGIEGLAYDLCFGLATASCTPFVVKRLSSHLQLLRQQLIDEVRSGDAFGFGVETRDQAVAQHGFGDKGYIFKRRGKATAEHGTRFGAQDQTLRRARPCAPAEHGGDRGVCVPVGLGAGFADEAYRVLYDVIGDRHFADEVLEVANLIRIEHGVDGVGLRAGGGFDNGAFLFFGGIVDPQVENEPVELGFGQGIRAFLFNGILRCQNKKRFFEAKGPAAGRDFVFLHSLQQSGLRFGWGAVDFVCQDDVGKQRAFDKAKCFVARGVIFFEDFGARDV